VVSLTPEFVFQGIRRNRNYLFNIIVIIIVIITNNNNSLMFLAN